MTFANIRRGFSQGEMIIITIVFFVIIFVVMLLFLFPGTEQIYWSKAHPIGITSHVIDENTYLKLNIVNNYGDKIIVTKIKVNGTWYNIEGTSVLSSSKLNDKITIKLSGYVCPSGKPYSLTIGFMYILNNNEYIQEGEIPITGKCRGI